MSSSTLHPGENIPRTYRSWLRSMKPMRMFLPSAEMTGKPLTSVFARMSSEQRADVLVQDNEEHYSIYRRHTYLFHREPRYRQSLEISSHDS